MGISRFINRKVYYVHAFPDSGDGYISEYKVSGTKLSEFTSSLFFTAIGKYGEMDFSARDCNVIPNAYNCHRLFTSKRRAKAYLKYQSAWRPREYTKSQWLNHGLHQYICQKQDDAAMDEFFNDYDLAW